MDSGGDSRIPRGPGDGTLLHQTWTIRNNWRETKPPTGGGLLAKSWIAPGSQDNRVESIAVISRDRGGPDFLRPAADSPLATGGAGPADSALPAYVGAAPPAGVERWDWTRTWAARHVRFFSP